MEEQLADVAQRAVETCGAAAALYDEIRWGQKPDALFASSAPLVLPGETLTELGVFEHVEYSGSKGGRNYVWTHGFDPDKPRLCVNSEQKLVVVGGSYRVTERGIVG